MHQSFSTINSFGVEQVSRPQTRREAAKRHSVRANGWLTGDNNNNNNNNSGSHNKGGRRRRGSATRSIAENNDEEEEEDQHTQDFYDDSEEDHHHVTTTTSGGGGGGGGGSSSSKPKHLHNKLLQMSVSDIGTSNSAEGADTIHENITVAVSVVADPATLSPPNNKSDSNNNKKNIYALGVLSPAHLEKQPAMKKKSAEISPAAHEVVKVQFFQSGGKVVPIKSPVTGGGGIGTGIVIPDPSSTPHGKAKKKLSSLAKNLLSSNKSTLPNASSKKNKKNRGNSIMSSKYHKYAGDDTDQEDDMIDFDIQDEHDHDDGDDDHDSHGTDNHKAGLLDREAPRQRRSWEEVDAAIPVLQL